MFEGIVAYSLNKYLGKYIEDLDSENLNVGIFSGTVQLQDLRLKPEAFAEFGLPLEVKGGCVAKISIDIPWTSLYYDPILIHVEEVLVLAGPVVDRKYDPERDKRLMRAAKRSMLEKSELVQEDNIRDEPRGFLENMATTIANNVQVSIQNVHIRYEDTVSASMPFACGVVLQNLTAITTNSKWKPTQIDSDAKNIFKLLKVESFSIYWNPSCPSNTLVKAQLNSNGWKTLLRKGLATFSINGEDFEFILKPVSLKVKMILSKSKEAKVPKLLLDFVLQDVASQLSREQFLSIYTLEKSFKLMSVNFRFRKYFDGTPVKGHAREWWHSAYTAVVGEYIQPYTWRKILEHRKTYRNYKYIYKDHLHRPSDTELKLDLQQEEDKLDVTNILLAREEAKREIAREEPNMVKKVPVKESFWTSWFGSNSNDDHDGVQEENLVVGEKEKNWLSRMTAEERERLYEGIGYEKNSTDSDIPLHYIAHKLNFTLANCTFSLINYNHEILVVTVTHFLSSIETRPGAKAFKISARTESFVVEGASVENDLVPVLTADSVTSGSNVPHVFALDYEKSPMQVNADYGITISAEPMEVVYHMHAVMELLSFLQLPKISYDYVKQVAAEKFQVLTEVGKATFVAALIKHKTVHLNIDLKSPYLILPEYGSFQQGGSVIVIDLGRLSVNSDLQVDPSLSEDTTKMEAEERLYDRFNIALSGIQVLFADSGDEWRAAKQVPESNIHLIPKTRIQVVFSNSVKHDYKMLPRQKLNISVPALKLNLSDRRASMIMEFMQNLPLPKMKNVSHSSPSDEVDGSLLYSASDDDLCSHTIIDPSVMELKSIRKQLNSLRGIERNGKQLKIPEEGHVYGTIERYYSASDHSDDESEEWARIIDLPGFDDNVSPSNSINILLRVIIGEIALHLARSSDHVDKPYLMLRAEKLCVDVALMEFGPALQASLNRIQLVDKLHTGSSGEYLELVSSIGQTDLITILYRKVCANCPEFKSHFHQVEHSLVLDLTTLSISFHREAFVTLGRFLQYVFAKIKPRDLGTKHLPSFESIPNPGNFVFQNSEDPPVPPGATKFSISARMNAVKIRFSHTDLDLADLKVAGLEFDYVLKANEKTILRLDLSELCLEDLTEQTLYSKILSTEDENVFDIKYVKNSPHNHKEIDGNRNKDSLPMKVDGSIRVRFGRTIIVIVQSFLNELQRFFEPFMHPDTTTALKKSAENKVQEHVIDIQKSGRRLQLSIDIHAPTFLLPQKSTSPNALILNLGDLSVENFFQEVEVMGNSQHYIDNILVRLNSLQLSRAVILLDGKMEIREPILEPLKLRLDIKRALSPYHKEILLYEISGGMDIIKVNIGQRDLSTMIAIYRDNYLQLRILENSRRQMSSPISPTNSTTPTSEDSVKKLEAFLYTSSDIFKEATFTFITEGMLFTLYADGEEIRSSPVRDPNQALSMFELDEMSVSFEIYNDRAKEMKCSCQSATLVDARAVKTSAFKNIFQSYSGDTQATTGVTGISLRMPPMIDLTYRQTGSGDAAVDVVVEKTRLNVSVCYVLTILKFVSDALPGKETKKLLHPEETSTLSTSKMKDDFILHRQRLLSDNTSGYHSTASGPDEPKSLSISAVLRKPEIILFANPKDLNSEVIVLKMDILFDYSYNMGQGSFVLSLSGLQVLSCVYGRRKQTMCMVLHPCELEFTRTQKLSDDEVKMIANVSSVNLHLSAPVVHTIIDVAQEVMKNVQYTEDLQENISVSELLPNQDLWSPMNVNPQKWLESETSCFIKSNIIPKMTESIAISLPDVQVFCEVDAAAKRIPILYAKCSFESEISDWLNKIDMRGDLKLEMMYFNENVATWEPLLENVMINENQYRPTEIVFKVFRECSHPIWCPHNNKVQALCSDTVDGDLHLMSGEPTASSSSGNETEEEGSMTIIKRHKSTRLKRITSIAKSHDSSSLLAYPPDSDSENEDGMLEKIASTFDHLFSDEDSEENPSDSEGIADIDIKSDSGETETADNDESTDDHPVFMSNQAEDVVDASDNQFVADTAIYITIDSRDLININITPTAIIVIQDIISDFMSNCRDRTQLISCNSNKYITMKNYLGPHSTAKFLRKNKNDVYEVIEEVSGKLTSNVNTIHDLVMPLVDISPPDSDSEMTGDETDGFHISSALVSSEKCVLTTEELYSEKELGELYKETTEEKISLEVDGFDNLMCFMSSRTNTSIHALHPVKNKTRYYVLIQTESCRGEKTVTICSPLKVVNSLPCPVYLLCQKSTLEALGADPSDYSKNPFQDTYIRLTTLDVGQVYNVPLFIAYHGKLFLQPVVTSFDLNEYEISSEGMWWQDITVTQRNSKFLLCNSIQKKKRKFCVKVVCNENKEVKTPAAGTKLVPNYVLHLCPPVVIRNIMPFSISLHLKQKNEQIILGEGESSELFDVSPNKSQEVVVEVIQYFGIQWHGKLQFSAELEEHHPLQMVPETDTDGGNRHLSLHIHIVKDYSLEILIFSPYWIINKTGLPLQFRGSSSDVVYEATASASEPLMFRFKKHKRKKAKLRVYSSQWSKSFSLDTIGNSGVVVCTDKERSKKYQFFVKIQMSTALLTKIVDIKPYFLVANNTKNHLRFMEKNDLTDLWFDISPEQCLPFWPDTDSLKMFVKQRDSKIISQNFPISKPHTTVLRMDLGSALRVEVTGGEDAPTTIAFYPYTLGDAPVRVENLCEDLFLKIHQKCQGQVTLLSPYQSVLYTWDDPTKERTLIWNLYNRKKPGFPAEIFKDDYGHEKLTFHSLRRAPLNSASKQPGEESSSDDDDSESEDGVLLPKKTRKDKVVVYWVSYCEKFQRVLLFTQDDRIAREVKKAVDGENASLETFISLYGLGLSLINAAYQELAYFGLLSCPAIWEIEINHTWKLLTLELSAWLEDKWQNVQQKAQIKDYLQVDLCKMHMIKPFFGQLRRTYSPAVWCQLRNSQHQLYAHIKVHRFQIDNQLSDAIFPTVIYPGPTPQAIVRRSGPKPCFELAFLLHKSCDESIQTVKYLKLLVQEVHFKLDKGFLLSIYDFFTNVYKSEDEETKVKVDMMYIQTPLYTTDKGPNSQERFIFEYIHLSPIKVHFSFSPRGTVHKAKPDIWSLQVDVLDLLVNSIGATLSEVKDVELRMAFFEKSGMLCTPSHLFDEVKRHYASQYVQQSYVLILGLDILGNPYGLVKDFTQGLGDFFYEPFMGSVKGPDEFAESLARGARSLLGHVIGGPAGAVSLITGSVGQALSVLSFDEEFRKKRQQSILQRNELCLPETLLLASRGFVLGIVLGLSGVVVKPVTGAQQEGVEGFFRGIGKGLLGLITKPAGGVMDMVSMAFDGIRRAAVMGENVVVRLRLPRFINPSVGVKPYSPYQASGCQLLQNLSKGHYAETDIYWAHAALSDEDRADVLLITDKHMFLLDKCRFWGGWDVEWVISVDDIMTVPQISGRKLIIQVKQDDSILNFAGDERYIHCDDPKVLCWLKNKMEKLLLFNMKEKPCPANV